MPLPLAAIIAGGASVIGSGMGMLNQASANRTNMRLAKYKWEKDKEMWHMQNAYNTPEMQMKRFTEAGLNKNLMYGQGTHGNATNMPQYQAPKIESLGTPDLGGAVMNSYNAQVQEAQADQIRKQSEVLQAEKTLKLIDAAVKGARNPETKELLDIEMKKHQNDIAKEGVKRAQQEVRNLLITEELLNKDLSIKEIQRENEAIEREMRKMDKNFMKEYNVSRLDNPTLKLLYRLGKDTGKSLQWMIKQILGEAGKKFVEPFKN
jgi:hypothetical protein